MNFVTNLFGGMQTVEKKALTAIDSQLVDAMASTIVTMRSTNFSELSSLQDFDWLLASLNPFGVLGALALMKLQSRQDRRGFYLRVRSSLPYYVTDFGNMVVCAFDGNERAAKNAYAIGQQILQLAPQQFPELRRIW